jgi:hypothetical protein
MGAASGRMAAVVADRPSPAPVVLDVGLVNAPCVLASVVVVATDWLPVGLVEDECEVEVVAVVVEREVVVLLVDVLELVDVALDVVPWQWSWFPPDGFEQSLPCPGCGSGRHGFCELPWWQSVFGGFGGPCASDNDTAKPAAKSSARAVV